MGIPQTAQALFQTFSEGAADGNVEMTAPVAKVDEARLLFPTVNPNLFIGATWRISVRGATHQGDPGVYQADPTQPNVDSIMEMVAPDGTKIFPTTSLAATYTLNTDGKITDFRMEGNDTTAHWAGVIPTHASVMNGLSSLLLFLVRSGGNQFSKQRA